MLQESVSNVSSVFQSYVASVFIWMLHMFSHICCKCFIWMLCMFFKCFCMCFRRMFQTFHLSFLYVASVASECLKSRSGVTHGIRMGSWRGRERSPRVTFGGAGPHAAARQRRRRAMSGRRGPMCGRRKRTTAAGVRTRVSVRTFGR
jgi:hypothetical protein